MAWRSVVGKESDNHAQVVQVAVGDQHGLLLTDEGVVYSWGGKDDHGQLGRKYTEEAKMREPSPVQDCLRSEVIVQIACGLNHCLVLSQRGALFAWGYNKAGQLGVEGFTVATLPTDLDVKFPTPVKGFNGEDPAMRAKSCSCGPESSACVTTRGEVFAWGAISYYLFGLGAKYKRGENCTVPAKVRGVPPDACRSQGFVPDRISLHKDKFACTVAQTSIEDDFMSLIASLKARSSQLMAVTRHRQADGRDRGGDRGEGFEREELRHLEDDFRQQKLACDQRLRGIDDERSARRGELQRVSRELIVCDQQDTALTESANVLEVRRGEAANAGGASVANRTMETQLNDINHFKSSNKRSKLQLLAQRDNIEQELLKLNQEHTILTQQRQQVESRAKLIRGLQRGELGNKNDPSLDEGLSIANSKRRELAATDLQTLSGGGRFTGFREALSISDRALQDVSSALKEVSAAIKGGDGAILEEVLEANLKLRKECNAIIQEKLHRAESIAHESMRPEQAAGGKPLAVLV